MVFNNEVALITGATSGIGKATAILLANQGARVGVLSRTREEVEQTVAEINASTEDRAIALIADITQEEQLQDAYNKLLDKWGRLDFLFANAGINGVWAPLDELSLAEWQQTINVNLTGTFLTLKHAIPHMRRSGGSVVVTSSVNGTRMFTNTGATAYATTKAGQVALTKMLALEVAKYRIRMNVICPGAIDTDIEDNTDRQDLDTAGEPVMFPEGKIPLTDGHPGRSQQVAQLVSFLFSDASSHITGTELFIDGAQSLLQG